MTTSSSIESASTDEVLFYLATSKQLDMAALTWKLAFSPTLHSVPTTTFTATVVSGTAEQTSAGSSVWVSLVIGPGAAAAVALDPGDWFVYAQPVGLAGGLEPWFYVGVLTVTGEPMPDGSPTADHSVFRVLQGPAPDDLELLPGVVYFYVNDDGSLTIKAGEYV